MEMKKLISLAEKGSLKDFSTCLKGFSKPIPGPVLSLAIRTALAFNQPQKVQLLLDTGADPLLTNEENTQLLSHATMSGGAELVKLMLELGCDVDHKNIHNRTALHEAARFGNTDGVRMLIKAGADLDCRDVQGQTPLLEAIGNGYIETAMELVLGGADVHRCFSKQKETPLMLAASRGAAKLVKLLLEKDSEIESRDFIGCTPLMHAARSGSAEVVKLLLENGANKNARDKKGLNALQWASPLHPEVSMVLLGRDSLPPGEAGKTLLKAASDGNIVMIKKLLGQKVSVQPKQEGGESVLATAVLQRSLEAFKLLLEHNLTNIDYRHGKLLRTPLIIAMRAGDVEKAHLLLEHGADHTITDIDGRSAVNHAAIAASKNSLVLLYGYGAALDNRDHMGRNALHQAIHDTESSGSITSRTETVRWLLMQPLDPNAGDNAGITPLMFAANRAFADIVSLLIEAGARVDAQDQEGRTPLVHALYHGADYGYEDRYSRPRSEKDDKAAPVVRILLEAGADPEKCNAPVIASKWRWPGAEALLRSFIA